MKQTKVYLLTTILTLFSCILTSCGRHYDDNEIDICPENNTLSYLLHEFPEAPIKQTIDSPTTQVYRVYGTANNGNA